MESSYLIIIIIGYGVVRNTFHCTSAYVVRPALVVNVFLVTCPHAILESVCFGHYLALHMFSSITKINVSILSVVYPGNVQIVQDMLR